MISRFANQRCPVVWCVFAQLTHIELINKVPIHCLVLRWTSCAKICIFTYIYIKACLQRIKSGMLALIGAANTHLSTTYVLLAFLQCGTIELPRSLDMCLPVKTSHFRSFSERNMHDASLPISLTPPRAVYHYHRRWKSIPISCLTNSQPVIKYLWICSRDCQNQKNNQWKITKKICLAISEPYRRKLFDIVSSTIMVIDAIILFKMINNVLFG